MESEKEDVKKSISLSINHIDVATLELTCEFKNEKLKNLIEEIKKANSANEQKIFLDEVSAWDQ
jgi:hypothetical protein